MEQMVEKLTSTLSDGVKSKFELRRTVLSYSEYLELVIQNPLGHLRSAAQYFANVIAHFGSYKVTLPVGEFTRYRIFDAEFDRGEGQVMGQERVQDDLVRNISNFVRAGRIDRLILLHGPNGSAKTSLIQALARGAEVYSETQEGALYRFNWIFPTKKVSRGSLGFSGTHQSDAESFAHLDGSEIETRIPCEYKDHPLLLLGAEYREGLIRQLIEKKSISPEYPIPDILRKGDISSKNKKIFDALLINYHGDVHEVLRHVQVERFYLSRRYRMGIASVDPQMSVDAYARQVTLDQSLSSLPSALQHLSLFETGGALSEGNRGLIEYNDLLKRPVESWKYLLVATEQAHASIDVISLFLDLVMIASSNELHLSSFREYPDWQSFKGRFELIKVPYLVRFSDELSIYTNQIPRALASVHIAPHSLEIAARWAVLTRLEAPRFERYPDAVQELIKSLTPLEKLELFDKGVAPERLSQKEARELKKLIPNLYAEYSDDQDYEGRYGASPREIRGILLNAAQSRRFDHLSPIAVLNEIKNLTREKSSYEFLRRETIRGYRDAEHFVDIVQQYYIKQLDEEIRAAMGLIPSDSHRHMFERYIKHVSAWTKREKLANSMTGKLVDPDEDLMSQIERVLLAKSEAPEEFRKSLIAQIGAFRLEQPDQPMDYDALFGHYLRRLKEDYYAQQRKVIEHIQNSYLRVVEGEGHTVDEKDREQVKVLRQNLENMGYNDSSAKQAIAYLLKR